MAYGLDRNICRKAIRQNKRPFKEHNNVRNGACVTIKLLWFIFVLYLFIVSGFRGERSGGVDVQDGKNGILVGVFGF